MTAATPKSPKELIVVQSAEHIASATDVRDLPAPTWPQVAFAGRSNVGKSSLINALVSRKKLVRTSSTPGCTRGLSVFRVQLAQGSLELVDLPGYGYAQRSKAERKAWGPMIEAFLKKRTGLRAVVVLCDLRRGLVPDDAMLIEFLASIGRPVILVATKADKVARAARKAALDALAAASGLAPLAFSATEGFGREDLWRRVLERTDLSPRAEASQASRPDQGERSAADDEASDLRRR